MTADIALPGATTFDGLLAWCREQRRNGPVRYNEAQDAWELFDHADVSRVLLDPATFSSDFSGLAPSQPDFDLFLKGDITGIDPPRHRKLRGLVSQALTPRMVAELASRIRAHVEGLLDETGGAAGFDFVEVLADPLPILVMSELLGIPASDWPVLRGWARTMLGTDVGDDTTDADIARAMAELAPTMRAMNAYLAAHIQRMRARPGADLTSRLILAELDGERLADDEILGFIGNMLAAGHITMIAHLTNIVAMLDEHPDVAAVLRADPSARPAAMEEVLRYRPPFPQFGRRTTGDVEIAGITIPGDRMITLWVASANRDPSRFDQPDLFDIHREPNPHVTFGKGIHFCLGAAVARLETMTALDVLLRRYGEIKVGPGVEFRNPWLVTAAKRLPVEVS